ncbi:MAG: GGDEF domain-containing protein [Treponema sp.]|nr:GGDEF domain-containing protein [Candidatus Treponema equifaecale]
MSIERDEKLTLSGSSEFKYLAETYNAIYEIKAQNEKELIFNAEYDALTEILNRRAFEQICTRCKDENEKIALLLIDLDNFKYINDNYGHAGGDIALKTVAQMLKNTFRTNDYVCRIGGDEFAVILRNLKAPADEAIVRKVQYINELLTDIEGGIKPVSISVGIAFSDAGYSEKLYQNADLALYKVKENGKRGCMLYSQEMEKENENLI